MTNTDITTGATVGGYAFGFGREGYHTADLRDLTATDVQDAPVYGLDDESIGEISALKMGTDGVITDAVIDVGGLLGLGVHSVLLPFGDLTVLRETDSAELRIYVDSTKEKLKAMPHHTG